MLASDGGPVLGAEPVADRSIDPQGPMLGRIVNPNRDLFWSAPAGGAHDQLPFPSSASISDLSAEELAATLDGWRERMRAHAEAACVHLSVDPGAGAAQLYAFDFVPQLIARERERFGAYATRTMGGNLLADLVQEEVKRRERIVAIDDDTVLMAPYGSRVPYQLLIAPRRPRRSFEEDGPTGAPRLFDALRRLRAVCDGGAHVFVRTAPSGAEYFCWRIEILPATAAPTALELGTGLQLNPVTPERAAAELRSI